jgi:NADP-dependent 3-hydroxy acid dehydrogenase YdfG
MALKVDISDRSSLRDAAAAVERELGCIHLLCNNAGVAGPVTKLHETSEANWDWTVGVNFMGVVNGLQTFLPTMLEHVEGSHFINTSSIGGVRRYPGLHPMGPLCDNKVRRCRFERNSSR